jgi:hypothetical protein
MKIVELATDRALESIGLALTRSEASELRDSLDALLAGPGGHHEHVADPTRRRRSPTKRETRLLTVRRGAGLTSRANTRAPSGSHASSRRGRPSGPRRGWACTTIAPQSDPKNAHFSGRPRTHRLPMRLGANPHG